MDAILTSGAKNITVTVVTSGAIPSMVAQAGNYFTVGLTKTGNGFSGVLVGAGSLPANTRVTMAACSGRLSLTTPVHA